MGKFLQVIMDDRIPRALLTLVSPEIREQILDIVAAAGRNHWINIARRELKSSKPEYIRAIQPIESSPKERILSLVGAFPDMVEQGREPFDLRRTLLGPHSTIRKLSKKGGFYANVPFRHGTPASEGLAGTPMGASYASEDDPHSRRVSGDFTKEQARALGDNIYFAAKQLRPTKAGKDMRTKWGERLPPGVSGVTLLRPPNPAHPDPRMRRGHVVDIYAGMVKVRHKYEKATQTQYLTWRTISDNVQHGWIHPGIEAHHIAEKVSDYINKIIPSTVKMVCQEALKQGFRDEQKKEPGK